MHLLSAWKEFPAVGNCQSAGGNGVKHGGITPVERSSCDSFWPETWRMYQTHDVNPPLATASNGSHGVR